MLKIPSRVTKRLMLTDSAFRQLTQLLSKAANDCSTFDAEKHPPKELRQKYDGVYQRLVELHNDDPVTLIQRNDEAILCFGLSYNYDPINRVVVCQYCRTMATKVTKFTMTFEHENGSPLQQATKNCDPEDKNTIYKLTAIYGSI